MPEWAIQVTQYTIKHSSRLKVYQEFRTKSEICAVDVSKKMTVARFPKESKTKTTQPLQLVHSDVMGPMKTKTPGGSRFYAFIY